eukprot:scaffold123292_cov20-Prasinocladus_malaysianus.AAC.1
MAVALCHSRFGCEAHYIHKSQDTLALGLLAIGNHHAPIQAGHIICFKIYDNQELLYECVVPAGANTTFSLADVSLRKS